MFSELAGIPLLLSSHLIIAILSRKGKPDPGPLGQGKGERGLDTGTPHMAVPHLCPWNLSQNPQNVPELRANTAVAEY